MNVLLRIGLGLFAFILLWRVPEPEILSIPMPDIGLGASDPPPTLTLVLQTLLAAIGGAAFALAAKPSWGDWTFRWTIPVALALVPLSVVVIQLLVFTGAIAYGTEGVIGRVVSFVVSNLTLKLPAVLVGVALAQGVVSDDMRGVQDGDAHVEAQTIQPSARDS